MKKRVISLLLTFLIVLSIVPMGIFSVTSSAASYIFPVLGNWSISSEYGMRWGKFHYGIDIQTYHKNNTVVSTASGVVKEVHNSCQHVSIYPRQCEHYTTYGNMIVIANDNGTFAYYGHLMYNSIRVSVGQRVSEGQAIAQVGSSGYSDGEHLHFEIRKQYNQGRSTSINVNVNTSITSYQYINTDSPGPTPSGGGSNNNNYYDTSINDKKVGTYQSHVSDSVNMRTGAGTNHSKIGLVAGYATVYVYQIDHNWGKCNYGGKDGWVCLNYFNYASPPVPSVPTSMSISAGDVAKGKTVTYSWGGVSDAKGYKVAIRGEETKEIDVGAATSFSYTLNNAGTYSFYVLAYNSEGKTNGWSSNYKSCTSHNPSTVTFVDWDNTVLKTQTVEYGQNATAPEAPYRKGYTFQNWDSSYFDVKSNRTIKAVYKINTYIVNFLDKEGNALKTQVVEYNKNAVEPTDKNVPAGYTFSGWASDAWKNVYTDAANRTINVRGIYKWENANLPILCSIERAQAVKDGYYVYLHLKNYDQRDTTGRAVVSLKTKTGKLVEMTESAAFSLGVDVERSNFEVFVPTDKVGSVIEVVIVDNYSSGCPISKSSSKDISNLEKWSFWIEESKIPSDILTQIRNGTLESQKRTEYRYRDKQFATGSSSTAKSVNDGWFYTGRSENAGSWSSWTWNYIASFDNTTTRREVKTQSAIYSYNPVTQWFYNRYTGMYGNSRRYGPTSSSISLCSGITYQETGWLGSAKNYIGQSAAGAAMYDGYWYNQQTRSVNGSANYATQYSYRDISYVYNFYRWQNWSSWSPTYAASSSTREVETRTTERYKKANVSEEDTGDLHSFSGKVDTSFAGKQLTMFVYKIDGLSDYTNEFVGQTIIGSDGSYNFSNYKLREEPTAKTGDFTIAIGIEGTSDLIKVGTIDAPDNVYTVKFLDWDGSQIGNVQSVVEGGNASLPSNPSKVGYNFIGWDKSINNITSDTEITAVYEKQQFSVVFVDFENKLVQIRKFEYGDALETPELDEVEGYDFKGWDVINDGTFIVTEDLVVTAEYEKKEYTVKFYDYDNNVISTQVVEYGEDALAPAEIGETEDGKIFAGWKDLKYSNVDSDAYIYPVFFFDETADIPTANYEDGEYDGTIQLELQTTDENDVIYYYFDGADCTEQEYTGPITIDKTESISFYAVGFGKNNSAVETKYYCINSNGEYSDWMLEEDVPEGIIDNPDSFTVETKTGYSFKDVTTSSSVSEIEALQNDGWTFDKKVTVGYSDWQDTAIEEDEDILDQYIDISYEDLGEDDIGNSYKYVRYKYSDDNGDIFYSSMSQINGVLGQEEVKITVDLLKISGIDGDGAAYSQVNDEKWYFKNPCQTSYRSSCSVATLYKWTPYVVDSLTIGETRDYRSAQMYRYTNVNYHIVTAYEESSDTQFKFFVKDNSVLDINRFDNVYGYNLDKVYCGENFESVWTGEEPITSSITLLLTFTKKEYNVIFKTSTGIRIDSQKIKYLEPAVEPEIVDIPGYVFTKWDKDFSCITENTVVTGNYIKESEYPRITLNRATLSLITGTYFNLYAQITPSELIGEEIVWSSSVSSVATVDDNGKVTGQRAGKTIITATVLKNGETASCEVTVQNDIYSMLMLSDKSNLKYDQIGYLRGIKLQTTVGDVKKEFINDSLVFVDINDNELSDDDYVGTGTVIKLMDKESVADNVIVVVTGDIDGDGECTTKDSSRIMRFSIDLEEFTMFQIGAGDLNGDGSVNNKDAAIVSKVIVGKYDIDS